MTPRIGSLCSGYGGLEMGLMAVIGGSVAWHVEYDKHPAAVLEARFPGVPNYGDVTTTDWTQVEPVSWLAAGFPCQPASHAGKRNGMTDERWLWDAVACAVAGVRPRWVLLENVPGLFSVDGGRAFERVICDLAAMGYVGRYGVVRASDAGAPHRRERVFIVAADAVAGGRRWPERVERGLGAAERLAAAAADSDAERHERGGGTWGRRGRPADSGQPVTDADEPRHEGPEPAGRRLVSARRTAADADSAGCGELEELDSSSASWLDGEHRGHVDGRDDGPDWGAYTGAIRRWERVIGRCAPRPTEPGRNGERLAPRFVEWMQGLPAGHVTDVLPRSPALKCLGNGVVPQQAALAVWTLLTATDSVGQQVPA